MMALHWLVVLFAAINLVIAAPVTLTTVTAVTNADGSTYVFDGNLAPTASATIAAEATSSSTPNQSDDTQTPTSTLSWSGLFSLFGNWLSLLDNTLSTSASKPKFSWSSLLSALLGLSDNENSYTLNTLTASTPSSTKQKTTSTSSEETQAPSSTSVSDDGGDGDFAQSILQSHNKYRAAHGAKALSWSQDAYNYAQNNADSYDCSGVLTHTHGKFGENLAAGFSSGPAAVDAWYSEGKTFDYNLYNEYNHFTQVVWKSTTQLGCAYKDCRSQGWGLYVICEYSPPGNVIGQEKDNVLPS